MKHIKQSIATVFLLLLVVATTPTCQAQERISSKKASQLDQELTKALKQHGFTGTVDQTLQTRLGRSLNVNLADLGRNLFFDKILSIQGDNACAGCHAPAHGFADTQSIAIGINNNNLVGANRQGPRNQRRTPMVLNTAFFPRLMWNSRFFSVTDDPFDNSEGFLFTPPEGDTLSYTPHLMMAQAFIPPTERTEMAGFEFPGTSQDLRDEVMLRLNGNKAYRDRFQFVFLTPDNTKITYDMLAAALAEFQFSLTFADAPIDQFARGDLAAMTNAQKKGALLFFGKAKCVSCHAVSGTANQMFSDFTPHNIAVPQLVPEVTNVTFDGPGQNEDFGLEQVTGNAADRYKFRTAPLRNCDLQPTFFHNGSFTTVEAAIEHHLNPEKSLRQYQPQGRVANDLSCPRAPVAPLLARLDPILKKPIKLSRLEFTQLTDFVRFALLDSRATSLEFLIPEKLVSGMEPLQFEASQATELHDRPGD